PSSFRYSSLPPILLRPPRSPPCPYTTLFRSAPLAFGQSYYGSYGGSYSGQYQQPAYGYGSQGGTYQQAPQAAYGSQGGYAGGYYSAPPVTYQAAPVYSNVTYAAPVQPVQPIQQQAYQYSYRRGPLGATSIRYAGVGSGYSGYGSIQNYGRTCINGVCCWRPFLPAAPGRSRADTPGAGALTELVDGDTAQTERVPLSLRGGVNG